MNIYVGNLPFATTEQNLNDLFSEYGSVERATIITDRMTGRSRGFGFVEMSDDSEARSAIEGLNGKDMDGRTIVVNEARAKGDRRGGGQRRDR
ncbi:MAG: RNA-binding protein [Planctomycetota bacterium]|nr:MAG: RNA-binding protein [Planctomycetota bacterium]